MLRHLPVVRDNRLDLTGYGFAGSPFSWDRISNLVSRYDASQTAGSRARTAATFDGSSYLTRPDDQKLDHAGEVSCWCWINRSEVGATGRSLISKWDTTGEYVLELNTNNSKAQFKVHDGTGVFTAIAATLVNVGSKFWFICGTADASEVKVYVGDELGGALVTATASPVAGVQNSNADFYLGSKNAGDWNFQGEMDFPMLAHTKLTDTQVTYLYNAGVGRSFDQLDDTPSASVVAKSDILAAWPLGEDSAERADIA